MTDNEITGDILDAAIKVHRRFGPGMLESVYERLLEAELVKRGHTVERQKQVSFEYEGMTLEDAFRVDLFVDGRIVVELKAVEKMNPLFFKQVKTIYTKFDNNEIKRCETKSEKNYIKENMKKISFKYIQPYFGDNGKLCFIGEVNCTGGAGFSYESFTVG